jgi:hypothetical protein
MRCSHLIVKLGCLVVKALNYTKGYIAIRNQSNSWLIKFPPILFPSSSASITGT